MINVAHDNINELNLYNYNIYPTWVDKEATNIISLFSNDYNTFYLNTLSYFYERKQKCIYPIILFNNSLFTNYESIDLDKKLVEFVKHKLCKIIFVYCLEGLFGEEMHYEWIKRFKNKYSFESDNVLVITSNLKAKLSNEFSVIHYDFFGNHLNFSTEYGYKFFLNKKPKFHFLCFNGIPRLNRLLMFAEFYTNNLLKNKVILSLRNTDSDNKNEFYEISNIEFYKNYDSTKNYNYDIIDWQSNKVGGGSIINIASHIESFLNVVTETMYDEYTIFISEKTYKPIYTCQPFIIFGNPHSLRKLKELGYKTFDKWWDESYDDEIDLNVRFKKIVSILEKISTFSILELEKIKLEMQEILIHNHKTLLSKTNKLFFINQLQNEKYFMKKNII